MARVRWTILALPLLLSGCLVPLPLTIASLSLSGAAYLDTGKTMPEHALSAATARDCSFFRAVNAGGPVCQSEGQFENIMLAGGANPDPDPHGCDVATTVHEASLTGCSHWKP